MKWNEGLKGAYLRIAATNRSPLRIVAGPGTGKTFSLMRRVARLLQEDGVKPKRIFVSTFTRTAARDLEKTLREMDAEGATDVRAGTIHSFCFSVLAREEVFLATGRSPRPLLTAEERFLLEDLRGEPFGKLSDCKNLLQAFNAAWARLQSEEPGWPANAIDRQFEATLDGWLRFHQGMLIGEIVPVTLSFLRDNPSTPILTAFDHVIVDEYQDLNRSEQVLLDVLAANGRFTLVGDEDQSIYSFKHAHPQGISQFKVNHPETHDESLEECRRCPQTIVKMANALITYNHNRQPRELEIRSENCQGEVHIIQWWDIAEEAQGIARFIHARVQGDVVGAGEVLVLAPRRQFGYAIRDALKRLGTPAVSFFQEEALDGDPKKLGTSQAQQAFTLLNLLADLEDRVALRCWCGFGSPSLRSGAWKRLRRHCEQTGQSPREALEQMIRGELTLPNCQELVNRFALLKESLSGLTDLSGKGLIDRLFPADQRWAQALRAAAETIDREDVDALKLREGVRTAISQPELPVDVDYVRVMSLHKSKGLTADLVVVTGCIQGLIPKVDLDLTPDQQAVMLEEHRRLFYVALTRARQTLVLSSVMRLPQELAYIYQLGAGAGTMATTFLSQLGPTRPVPVQGKTFLRNQGL